MEKPTHGICVDSSITPANQPTGYIQYRGVDIATGVEIFSYGRYPGATNNVAEYLALVEGLMYLHWHDDLTTPLYSDSEVAIRWVTNDRRAWPSQPELLSNGVLFLLWEATHWLNGESVHQVYKWNTSEWGEIPADYGRKNQSSTDAHSKSGRRVKAREAAFERVRPRWAR